MMMVQFQRDNDRSQRDAVTADGIQAGARATQFV